MILEVKGGPSVLLREYGSFWAHPPGLKCSRQEGKTQGESLPGELVFWVLTSPASWVSAAPWCLYTLVSMWMCHLGRGTDHMVRHHLTVEHRFLLFSTIDILSQITLWCGDRPVLCRLLSLISGLYPLDAIISHPFLLWEPEMSADVVRCLLGTKIAPSWESLIDYI